MVPPSALLPRPRAGSLAAALPPAQRVLDAFFRGLMPRTVEAYKEALNIFGMWAEAEGFFKDPPDVHAAVSSLLFSWSALDAHSHILEYLDWMKERGFAPNTINQRLSALRSLLRLGRQLGVISWGLDVKGVRSGRVRDVRGPGPEEVTKLLAYSRQKSTRLHALFLLFFERGLRGIEVRELQLGHLKLATNPPSIMVRGKGKAGLTPLTVSKTTKEALERWLEVRALKGVPDLAEPNSFVFSRPGQPFAMVTRSGLWAAVSGAGKACGIKLWPHALRHSAITEALNATHGDVRKVQKFSRHAKVETVLAYDDDRRDLGGDVSEMLSRRGEP